MAVTCAEIYFPPRNPRLTQGIRCARPAKCLALHYPFAAASWDPVCGIHARLYERTKPLPAAAAKPAAFRRPKAETGGEGTGSPRKS
jgi:hypothetical protein